MIVRAIKYDCDDVEERCQTIEFTAQTPVEGVALERLDVAINSTSTLAESSFVIGKDNTIVYRLPIYDLIVFAETLKRINQ